MENVDPTSLFALGPHRSAVCLDDVSNQRQPQAHTSESPARAGIDLMETIENSDQLRMRDPDSAVLNPGQHPFALLVAASVDGHDEWCRPPG